jgi:hypothetical protein
VRVRAYIWVRSKEETVRAIDRETQVKDATVRKLKALDPNGEILWSWKTPQVNIDWGRADEELNKLLSSYRSMFPKIKKHRGPNADIYLQLVTEYDEGEDPKSFSISMGTIGLMSELGCDLDDDVYGFRLEDVGKAQ